MYSVSIEYECSISQNCFLYASAGSQIYETGKTIELRKDRMNTICNITLEKDVQDFEVIPMYNGQGTLRINNIVIRHIPDLLQNFLGVFAVFISFDLWMHFRGHANMSDYSNSDVLMMQDYDTAAHDAASVGMEDYLRYGTERSALWGNLLFKNMQEVSLLSRKGHTMELYCRAEDINGYVEVPMLHYKGYRVMDEYGNQYKIEDRANNVIRFWLQAEFSGKVRIDFAELWYWRAGELISVLAVMCLCGGCVVRRYMTVNRKRIRLT